MKLIQQHLPLSFMETHAEQTPVTVGWGGVGGECGGHLKTQLEIQGSKEEKKNGHNRNSHIPNITPRLHQSRSSGMWETVDVMPESVFCEDVLPVDGGERPLGPGFGPVWLGLACHVYVCGKTQNGETNPLSVIRAWLWAAFTWMMCAYRLSNDTLAFMSNK